MKLTTKLTSTAAVLSSVALIALGTGQALAFTDGQINGGNIYRVEDLTQNTGFSDTITAKACDLLEYRVRLYNPGSQSVDNVNVQADVSNESLTSNQSTIEIKSADADPSSVYANATVNFASAQTESYVAGSTQLLDQNDNPLQNLPDGITVGGTGVNAGSVGPSVTRFVQFQEQVNCPTPVTPSYACTELGITAEDNKTVKISNFETTATNGAVLNGVVIDWGDNTTGTPTKATNAVGMTHQYSANGTYTIVATASFMVNGQAETATSAACSQKVTFSSTTPPTVTPPTTPTPSTPAPTTLVNTGAGNTIGLFAAVTVAGTVAYRYMLGRRLSRQ